MDDIFTPEELCMIQKEHDLMVRKYQEAWPPPMGKAALRYIAGDRYFYKPWEWKK